MNLLHLIVLGLIQGLTEFLPVSSSAHLILLPELAGWQDQGLSYDVAAHFGSLIAVIVYFRADIGRILTAGLNSVRGRTVHSADSHLFWYLLIASIPVLVCGYLLRDIVEIFFRDPLVIASASIVFGVLLWISDSRGKRQRNINSIDFLDAVFIGLAQAIALVPGTSRSGITITAGLLLGLERASAARFSFLLAIPIILAAALYEGYKLLYTQAEINLQGFAIVIAVSAISAILAIHYFLQFLERTGMLPYVIYRVGLGLFLFWIFL